VKLLGPDQLQVTGIVLVVEALNVSGFPEHIGEGAEGLGLAGVSFTTIVTVF
jgi:hypothetical protein